MPLFYLDASALVKLVRAEPETAALNAFLDEADDVTSEIALTEVARTIRRVAGVPAVDLDLHMEHASEVFESVGLLAVERDLLLAAGAIPEPGLRSLDAIHLASAIGIPLLDAFVSYDERQAAAARISGLRTLAPRG